LDVYRRQTSPPRLPIIVARVWPSRKRDFPLFPLGEPVEAKPWMRARPACPDMLPAIGKAPRHTGL
jgi:D-amino-acid dehydrogenase